MIRDILRYLLVFALGAVLTGCAGGQKAIIDVQEMSFIRQVSVRAGSQTPSGRLAAFTKIATQLEASRYGVSGTPKEIRVTIRELSYMDPASAVFGAANSFEADVSVVDVNSGRVEGEFAHKALYASNNNLIFGAIEAANQNRVRADIVLAKIFASEVMEKIYGGPAAKEARKRPIPGAPATPMNDIEFYASMAKQAPDDARKVEPRPGAR